MLGWLVLYLQEAAASSAAAVPANTKDKVCTGELMTRVK